MKQIPAIRSHPLGNRTAAPTQILAAGAGVWLLVWLSVCPSSAARAAERKVLSPDVIYRQTLRSTVMVLAGDSQGTGWILTTGQRKLLITNQHVVADRGENVFIGFPDHLNGGLVTDRAHYFRKFTSGIKPNGRIAKADGKRDLALVELFEGDGPALKLAAHSPKAGEQVHILGNPGTGPMWKHTIGRVLEVTRDGDIRITTPSFITAGNSGGPVVNDHGELVGVIAAVRRNVPALCYAVDVLEVKDFLAEHFLRPQRPAKPRFALEDDPVQHFSEEILYNPKVAAHYRNRAAALIRAGRYDDAIADCTQALRLDPEDPYTYNERGAAYSFKDRYDDAIADYSRALALHPELAIAYRNRGGCYYFQGDYERAIADCSRAIELDPKDARAFWRRSQAFAQLNRATDANRDRMKALQLNPALK